MTPSKKSRTGNNSQSAGWCIEFSCSRNVTGTPYLHVCPQVLHFLLGIWLEAAIDLRLRVIRDKIEQVPARLAVLEQDQKWHRQHGHHVLEKHIHRNAKHLALEESAEDVGERRQAEHHEQVLKLQAQKRH